MKTHKDLIVWKKSIDFVTDIYKETNVFPKQEQYGLVSQLRRAAVSIPSNIAEGASRKSRKEFIQFLHIARASSSELETQLIISKKIGYLSSDNLDLEEKLSVISKMLTGLINNLERRN
jgi:four helix bundle protein